MYTNQLKASYFCVVHVFRIRSSCSGPRFNAILNPYLREGSEKSDISCHSEFRFWNFQIPLIEVHGLWWNFDKTMLVSSFLTLNFFAFAGTSFRGFFFLLFGWKKSWLIAVEFRVTVVEIGFLIIVYRPKEGSAISDATMLKRNYSYLCSLGIR